MDKPPNGSCGEILTALQGAIWQRRLVLREIMEKHGGKNLYRYSQDFLDVNKSPRLDARKSELVSTVQDLLRVRLGAEVADRAARQLAKLPLVSTADHHGPIDNPFWVNSNIIMAVPYAEVADPDIQFLIAFSFASVSVNNASGFPRGIEFHGGVNGSGNYLRLPILPDKLKMGVVYGTRSFTREDLTKAEQELAKKEQGGSVAAGRGGEIRNVLEQNFGKEEVLQAPDLASQITRINFAMWPKLFHGGHTSGRRIPDLIYLEIETIVTELLLKFHLKNPQSLIHRLLFHPDYRRLALRYFNKLGGAFSLEEDWGTYMFWAVDSKLHRVRLALNTTQLFSKKRNYEFDFTPEAMEEALRQKKIFPSMLLCYLMISLYYGMKCLGGFSQVHDLTMTKNAWEKLLREIGETEEADAIVPVQTKELSDGLMLSYLKTANGELVPATGIDMILEREDTSFANFVELSKKVTLTEMMNPMFPEIYKVLYSSFQRDPGFLALTPEQILRETGLEKKLR